MKLLAWSTSVSLAAALWLRVKSPPNDSIHVLEDQSGGLNASNLSIATAAVDIDLPSIKYREPRVLISNQPRRLRIRNVDYAYTDGPNYEVNGSPDQQAGVIEALALLQYNNWNVDTIGQIADQTAVQTLEDCNDIYAKTKQFMPTPPSTDQSDENFGALRLSRSGFSMELLRSNDLRLEHVDLNLTNFPARTLCGANIPALFATNSLFVSDFSDVAKYNDPDKPEKFTANVQGFFCVDRRDQRFMPLAVRLVDSNLVYTPFDPPNESGTLLTYGTWLYEALDTFVESYLRDFYASDEDVQADADLQTWALWASQLDLVLDFPPSFDSRQALKEIMVHTAFQNAVKHHMMNGDVCWEISSIPYSVPAIWKPLPLAKGATFDLDEYMMPHDRMDDLLSLVSSFSRKVPERLTLLHGYGDAGFAVETQELRDAMDKFMTDMQEIEQKIDVMERNERYPVTHVRPSKLPYFAWI